MKFGKRQVILAALILALGSAVYLNWQFTSPETLASSSELQETSGTTESAQQSSLGIAELVNNSYVEVETVTDEIVSSEEIKAAETSAKLSEARIDRQTARDSALELLDDILSDVDSDSEAKKQAIEEASVIAQNMVKESNIETLIKAKGIKDAVVYISDDGCSVIVDKVGDNILVIQDIIVKETGLTTDKITVTEIG